jgi:hypothetical protein
MDNETTSTPTGSACVPPIPSNGFALPSFESCVAAVSTDAKSGIEALAALTDPLKQNCPELAAILRSSSVRTSLDIYERQDVEAVRQQASLMREATLANICLMAAGVASGLVLAVAAQPSSSAHADLVGNITLGLRIITPASARERSLARARPGAHRPLEPPWRG